MPRREAPLLFFVDVFDNGTGVKNATLFYSTDSYSPEKYMSKDLTIEAPRFQPNVYQAGGTIPSLYYDANLTYYIESYDYAGNKAISDIHSIPFIDSKFSKVNSKEINYNETAARIKVIQIDSSSLIGEIAIEILAKWTSEFSSYDTLFGEIVSIQGINIDSNLENLDNIFENKTSIDGEYYEGFSTFSYAGEAGGSLKLFGDTSLYPFDQYYANLIIAIPVENVVYTEGTELSDEFNGGTVAFSDQILSSWISSSSDITKINISDSKIDRLDGLCVDLFIGREDLNLSEFCDIDNKHSFLNVRIDFTRNYTIAVIVIPLIAIYFLLGAIFIFENSSDNISNRLTLTLGIFALIFTLPEVINSMKPPTSGPSIADSMLSIIIIGTIAFTVSSVISSSSTIRNWFPKHHTWIDGIVFLIVSGTVIAYFSNFPFDITIWLVPVILFGLGYGLLLRILGVKITKSLFSRRKKTTITKV
jgi:hypothetical protein